MRGFVCRNGGKSRLERHRRRCRIILKLILKDGDVDCVDIAQDRDKWGGAVVNAVMNLQVP